MAYNDVYTYRSGSTSIASTTAVPLLSIFGTAAKRGWIVGVRVMVGNTTAAAGNNALFTLARPTASTTPNSSALSSGVAHDTGSPASVLQQGTAYTTAPGIGSILAEWELPMSSGAMWTEFPPTGDEWGVPAIANDTGNCGVHLFVTPSVNTSTPFLVDIIAAE